MQTKAPSSTSLIGNDVSNQSWMPSDDLIACDCVTPLLFSSFANSYNNDSREYIPKQILNVTNFAFAICNF